MTDHTNNTPLPETNSAKIRELNDRFRRFEVMGAHMATPSIMDMGPEAVQKIMTGVATFDGFTNDHDPFGEHDFGACRYDGQRIFWKIDYYNRDLSGGSENPANPQLTTRVMKVFLASEFWQFLASACFCQRVSPSSNRVGFFCCIGPILGPPRFAR
ncbi:DUF3768 domain-containing protein [Phaeobacter gallaeciensis]|uniref:DUF3768 domain-containing protein n=1 Tax=Phaeobacter gallaeciensis TaxID=60890 RepID=UPI00237F6D57|nr:DUF3768 domain-containing protein [Phaeobacter gallaeciensis]MDE4140959.1 DUF3768 domain-containing protein [Phaeobacter gallaeciensis]MDE4149404.1 DUF3768 domain-containing protein [Phaeobacter gallaeciensis]MDE4153403.1 DUF3768 domain-containing protein [Phaeobacter gallaeciensis]MDE4228792.1 DUF3768 domain-containing protein [Phaeobacter gallaeciensis]MDE4257867.1 DUF3768 domain-containing protein [Phaeobacter gallaeciensis]